MRLRLERVEECAGERVRERLGGGGRRVKTESEERDEKEKGGRSLVASSSCVPDWRFRHLLIL